VGGANNGITNVSTGSSAQVLTSNGASADPAFQSAFTTSTRGFGLRSGIANGTGDGTVENIVYDTVIHTSGTDITLSSATFTVNTTGIYQFDWLVSMNNLISSHTQFIGTFNFTAGGPQIFCNPFAISNQTTGKQFCLGASFSLSLAATNTFTLQVQVSGGTKTARISGWNNGSPANTYNNYFTYFRIG